MVCFFELYTRFSARYTHSGNEDKRNGFRSQPGSWLGFQRGRWVWDTGWHVEGKVRSYGV